MTWRLLILFSLVHQLSQGGSVLQGRVIAEPAIHGGGGHARQVDPSGAVIWLERTTRDQQQVRSTAEQPRHYQMLQKNKRFSPHILPILTGSFVDFPNADPIFHNAFSTHDGQIFDIGLYPPGTSRSIFFRRSGIVRVFCNIHSMMSALILVLDTPFFTVSDGDGNFKLKDVPEGTYTLHIFHERADERTLNALTRALEVKQPQEQIDPIHLTETPYLPEVHLNKYGKPYGPATSEPGSYPGAHP